MLAPLLSALDLAFAGSHSWEHMRVVCLELLGAYGGSAVKLQDSESRLKLATSYLQAAVKLSQQRVMVTSDVLGFCSDKALSAPCVDDVDAIMSRIGVGRKGHDACTGRDALFFLSSTLRAADCMWSDGFESDLLWDLQTAMRKCYPAYASQCCLSALPTAAAPVVPNNSIFSVWNASATGTAFGSNASPKADGGFPFLTGYFLLGPVVAVAAVVDGKGGKGAQKGSDASVPGTAKVQEPVLKRISLPRSDVYRLELKGAHYKELLGSRASAGATEEAVRTVAQDFYSYVADIVRALQGPVQSDTAANVELVHEGGGTYSMKVVASCGTCQLPVTVATAGRLAELFAPQKGCDGIVDVSLCSLLRIVFGCDAAAS